MIRKVLEVATREAGIVLHETSVAQFDIFIAELKKWNKKVNLTSITREEEIVVKHIIDSLLLVPLLKGAKALLDIGSGAGFPAIPVKIARPDIGVVAVDSVGKKISFQRQVCRLLHFQDYEALHARVESLHSLRPAAFDLIVSRAFSDLGTFVDLALPLLSRGGRIIAMKGPAAEEEIGQQEPFLRSRGLAIVAVHRRELPLKSGERCLIELIDCKCP